MLSLSFEGNTLRLLESEGKRVVRWHSALFNTALVRRGSVEDPAGLAKVLAKAVESGGFKGREVFVALEGTNTLSRVLSLPRGASVQVPDFIAREARRLWSVNQEESLLYWQPVAGTKGQFFVLSVPRGPLHALEETVRLAGLRPVGADLRPLCLARAINQGRAVAVCVEGNNIVIVVLVDHLPALMQTHLLGDMPLLPEDLAGQAANLLGQAMAYYNDSHAADRLSLDTPLFVCGGGVAPGLGERLHSETGFPLHEVATLLSAPAEFPLAHFMINLGLLMKTL